MSAPVRILYRNYRGEIAVRRIVPQFIVLGSNEYHPERQWLLGAQDVDKGALRTFALADVLAWGERAVSAVLALRPMSDAAPPSPWRLVESVMHDGDDFIIGADDRHVLGRAHRPAAQYLLLAGEFTRSLMPTKESL